MDTPSPREATCQKQNEQGHRYQQTKHMKRQPWRYILTSIVKSDAKTTIAYKSIVIQNLISKFWC